MTSSAPSPGAPTPPDGGRALRCPYCGSALNIDMDTVGSGYMTRERPESISCDNFRCDAVWEPDGDPRYAPRWVRYPDLYPEPTQEPSR